MSKFTLLVVSTDFELGEIDFEQSLKVFNKCNTPAFIELKIESFTWVALATKREFTSISSQSIHKI